MAELTLLESKLGEVLGLAQAAQAATRRVGSFFDDADDPQAKLVRKLHDEAAETEERVIEVAGTLDGRRTAILDKGREVKGEGAEMMDAYLGGEEGDPLEGFEFLTMTEAGESGHWAILGKLNEKAGIAEVGTLVEWALPLQTRHLTEVLDGALAIAADEDPNEIEE